MPVGSQDEMSATENHNLAAVGGDWSMPARSGHNFPPMWVPISNLCVCASVPQWLECIFVIVPVLVIFSCGLSEVLHLGCLLSTDVSYLNCFCVELVILTKW